MHLDFETGKLSQVALRQRADRKREYRLLGAILLATSVPYVLAVWSWPLATVCVVMFMAYFQVLMTFATSSNADTAHHIRFLLAGSNPIGMTGGSSLLFGAVDSVLDWYEDAGDRQRRPLRFWLLTAYKLMMTPIGVILMTAEYLWDLVLLQRPRLIRHKWNELFSLASYHSLVCPEKSNDIFYADLAVARFQNDPHLYQWNRLRAMVFELRHYSIDAEHGIGVPETNIFFQGQIAAFQTLQRLQLEALERDVGNYYNDNPAAFPIPARLAVQLIANARPIQHYLRLRATLPNRRHDIAIELLPDSVATAESPRAYQLWHLLRLLNDATEADELNRSQYVNEACLADLEQDGIVAKNPRGQLALTTQFRTKWEEFLDRHYAPVSGPAAEAARLATIPDYVCYRRQVFARRED